MNSNCTCVRSTTLDNARQRSTPLDNFALDQTSIDKKQSSRHHSTRWPNAVDSLLNMHVQRSIAKSRERLARALDNTFMTDKMMMQYTDFPVSRYMVSLTSVPYKNIRPAECRPTKILMSFYQSRDYIQEFITCLKC